MLRIRWTTIKAIHRWPGRSSFMVQELGETVDEMMKADARDVEAIMNKRPTGHYWIVIFYKPTQIFTEKSEQIIKRVVKAYDKRPENMLGTMILEVKDGAVINETVNMHDAPIDWARIVPKAGLEDRPYVQHRSDIAGAYLYNK